MVRFKIISLICLFTFKGSLLLSLQANPDIVMVSDTSVGLLSRNNSILQSMIIVLVVLVFGYGAKIYYEHRFRKD